MRRVEDSLCLGLEDPDLKEWITGSFTKIAVSVKSEKKLIELYEKVKAAGLRVSLITDNGHTVFNGVPTNTCIAIGPHSSEILDPYTKKYPLL
ncbi:peptidyl-tRNA hydrolase [Xanthomonas phage Xoo-sp13]|nr:peptidyl-tRNA hydrolase [Xanthomonas phage Xoo-sp13]